MNEKRGKRPAVGPDAAYPVPLSRQSAPKTVDILHWSQRTLYLAAEDILAELDKELSKLVGRWNADEAGEPSGGSDAATPSAGEGRETE